MTLPSSFKLTKLDKDDYGPKDVLNWYLHNKDDLHQNSIRYFNGVEGMSGWELLNEARRFFSDNGIPAQIPVVKNFSFRGRVFNFTEYKSIDLVRRTGNGKTTGEIFYWFDFSLMRSAVSSRQSVKGFEAMAVEHGPVSRKYNLIIPCEEEDYDALIKSLENAELVSIEGMYVDASRPKKEQDDWIVVSQIFPIETDQQIANEVLSRLKNWQELIPMRKFDSNKRVLFASNPFEWLEGNIVVPEPLFSEDVSLAMLFSAFWTRESVPVFNTVFFGPSNHGKTSCLRYLVIKMLGGAVESGSTSVGKGWLISHAKEAPEPKIFTTKTALLVNEMFKSVASQQINHHSYSIQLKLLLEKHIEIFERTTVESSSGFGTVRGKMKCSFIGTENDDDNLVKGLGRVFCMAPAVIRRIQIGYAVREKMDRFGDSVNTEAAYSRMNEFFRGKFGPNALNSIKALFLFSRRFSENFQLNAPNDWKSKVFQNVSDRIKMDRKWSADLDLPDFFDKGRWESDTMRSFEKWADQFMEIQMNLLDPCYVSAAVIRGWEVHDSISSLAPVFDEKQLKMAEDMFWYFCKCKWKLLSTGIKDYVLSSGVARSPYGGMM